MKPRFFVVISALLLLAFGVSACFPRFSPSPVSEADQAATQEAYIQQAVQATSTTIAMQTEISSLQTQIAQATSGPATPGQAQPPATSTPPATIVGGATSAATFTPLPTSTSTPSPEPPDSHAGSANRDARPAHTDFHRHPHPLQPGPVHRRCDHSGWDHLRAGEHVYQDLAAEEHRRLHLDHRL